MIIVVLCVVAIVAAAHGVWWLAGICLLGALLLGAAPRQALLPSHREPRTGAAPQLCQPTHQGPAVSDARDTPCTPETTERYQALKARFDAGERGPIEVAS